MRLILLLTLAFVTRVFLYNVNGTYFFPDEQRYLFLHQVVSQPTSTEPFTKAIFEINGRPGFGILYLPALVSENEAIAGQILNIIISVGIVLLIYLICKKLTSERVAFLTGLVAIFSIPLIIYIRHLLPYDAGLFFILFGVYLWLRKKSFFIFGLFLGISFTIYPSHFYYFLPIPLLMFFSSLSFPRKRESRILWIPAFARMAGAFILGFAIPLVLMQLLSMLSGGFSYLNSLRDLSTTVTQGDYVSVFAFLTQYILANDGIVGLILMAVGVIFLGLQYKKKPFIILIIYILATLCVLEFFSDIAKTTVLYGRTVRPLYVLLLLSGSAAFFSFISDKKLTRITSLIPNSLFLILIVINWVPHYFAYKNTIFVQDFEQLSQNYTVDISQAQEARQSQKEAATSNYPYKQNTIYMINMDIVYPFYGMKKIHCNKKVLFSKPNALISFPPYILEGYDTIMRESIQKDPPRHEIFQCK